MAHFNTIGAKLGIGHPCCDQLTAVKKGYTRRYTIDGNDVIF